MLVVLLPACRGGLKVALGGPAGRRGSLELDVGGDLASGWWNQSQGGRTLKEDQVRHDTDESGFGQAEFEVPEILSERSNYTCN